MARWLPSFFYKWLKKTIHQDTVNLFLEEMKDLKDLAFANKSLELLQATVTSEGLENLPKKGGVIIAANHPLGGLDGLALMKAVGAYRPDVRFVVNDVLTQLPNFQEITVGVNSYGTTLREGLAQVEKAYADGYAVLIFPAGLCSRKNNKGLIRDLEWQKSFLSRAVKYQLPVIPTHVQGKNSSWFYNLSYWRKKIGISWNIEMLYLVDEMFRQKGQTIHISFGTPLPSTTWTFQRKMGVWANLLKDYIYEMKEKGVSFDTFLQNK